MKTKRNKIDWLLKCRIGKLSFRVVEVKDDAGVSGVFTLCTPLVPDNTVSVFHGADIYGFREGKEISVFEFQHEAVSWIEESGIEWLKKFFKST